MGRELSKVSMGKKRSVYSQDWKRFNGKVKLYYNYTLTYIKKYFYVSALINIIKENKDFKIKYNFYQDSSFPSNGNYLNKNCFKYLMSFDIPILKELLEILNECMERKIGMDLKTIIELENIK